MSTRKEQLKIKRKNLIAQIDELDQVILEISKTGTASATISSAGGSKSYSRLDLDKLTGLRETLATRVTQINRALRTVTPAGIRHVMTVRA